MRTIYWKRHERRTDDELLVLYLCRVCLRFIVRGSCIWEVPDLFLYLVINSTTDLQKEVLAVPVILVTDHKVTRSAPVSADITYG